MEKKLKKYSIIGIFVIFGLAAFWHFLFDLLPGTLTAVLSPVNESVWEHVKLFYCPALVWYAIMYAAVGKHYPNFLFSHALMLIVMPTVALLLHGAWRLFLSESVAADIVFTFVAIALTSYAAYKLTVSRFRLGGFLFRFAAVIIIIGILVVFVLFTFNPPNHPLFQSA